MHRLIFSMLWLACACGGPNKDAEKPSEPVQPIEAMVVAQTSDSGAAKVAQEEKFDECVGFEIGDLDTLLGKSACEETAKPDSVPNADLKSKLEVTMGASPSKIAPGGKADLVITFANKSKEPLTLHFRIDPLPRYELEVYDKKGKRVDLPTGKEPPPPPNARPAPPTEPKSARITLAPNGRAYTRLSWDAQKHKWAPEKYRGTPPERRYPRSPSGPLAKGMYTIKVVTPLIGVFEAGEERIGTPRVDIEIGG